MATALIEEQVINERACTRGSDHVVHLNNAGCSLPTDEVLDGVIDYLKAESMEGGYEVESERAADLQRPYTALASLLNCSPDEIAVVTSATAAWQQVVYGLARRWRAGDRLLTSLSEYGSNYIAYLQLARHTGVRICVIPETPAGDIDLQALEAEVVKHDEPLGRPVLISMTHVPTSSGRVIDAAGVGAIARRYGIPFMLDACQSVGQMPVDVKAIQCSFLSGTGRKFLRAPRGTGFLYCATAWLRAARFEPATLDNIGATWSAPGEYRLAPGARRFESYEMSMAGKVGLGLAVQHCLDFGIEAIWARVQRLAALTREKLAQVPGVQVQDHGAQLCGIVSFTVAGAEAGEVQRSLFAAGINVSVSKAPSTLLDFERRGLAEVVRASVHYYNTEGEIARLIHALEALPRPSAAP